MHGDICDMLICWLMLCFRYSHEKLEIVCLNNITGGHFNTQHKAVSNLRCNKSFLFHSPFPSDLADSSMR